MLYSFFSFDHPCFRLCNQRCVSYTSCDGPQECCGGLGGWYYSLSVVGDIDVAKEVLKRLRSKWLTVKEYRGHMMSKMGSVGFPSAWKTANWWASFENIGWSMCDKNSHDNYLYMHGLWRSAGRGAGLNHLEAADCREDTVASTASQECYDANLQSKNLFLDPLRDNWDLDFHTCRVSLIFH